MQLQWSAFLKFTFLPGYSSKVKRSCSSSKNAKNNTQCRVVFTASNRYEKDLEQWEMEWGLVRFGLVVPCITCYYKRMVENNSVNFAFLIIFSSLLVRLIYDYVRFRRFLFKFKRKVEALFPSFWYAV